MPQPVRGAQDDQEECREVVCLPDARDHATISGRKGPKRVLTKGLSEGIGGGDGPTHDDRDKEDGEPPRRPDGQPCTVEGADVHEHRDEPLILVWLTKQALLAIH